MYREYILEHYKNPRNKGHLDAPDIVAEDSNPLCGDEIRIELKLGPGHTVEDVRFDGRGCAISQASASILTEQIKGLSLDELKAITKDDVVASLGIPLGPVRLKCALLALQVLHAGVYGRGARVGAKAQA